IYWDVAHTDTLVEYLLTHPADCCILFSDKNIGNLTSQPKETTTKPSGHTKRDIHAIIAKAIFEGDLTYGGGYNKIPDKLQVSVDVVNSQTDSLKSTYWKHYGIFKQSGGGVVPSHPQYPNLLDTFTWLSMIIAEFPYYEDLHSLWKGDPSYSPNVISSEPKKNHAGGSLSLVKD
ncbi:hypothetical protein PAXRUDRAFT_76891, partial [Paxillus rubicundulus Ve08.2h10]